MGNQPASINLYQKNKKSFLDKFIDWSLSTGRVIVILTEIIALSAFLYRFSLDRKLVDIHDEIKVQETIIQSQQTQEKTYRELQKTLQRISTIDSQASDISTLLFQTQQLAPSNFIYKSISLSSETLRISAEVFSVPSLSEFITQLKHHPQILSVSLDRIENKTSTGVIVVDISAKLKPTK